MGLIPFDSVWIKFIMRHYIRTGQLKKFEGLVQPVSDKIPDLYMVAAPGAYSMEYGIAPEWETLIF